MIRIYTSARPAFWLVVLAAFMLSACSGMKQDLFEMAMEYEREQAGLELKTLDVNGKSIALLANEKSGKPTLVLVHGFAANKENWVRFAAYLTDDFHVVAVDLPGHGQSIKDPTLGYDIDDQVGYLHEILAQLEIQQFHLAGNSMGGAISSLYAATYPDQVLSIALFNPAGIYEHESKLQKHLINGGENPLVVRTEEDFSRLMDLALEEQPFIPWPIKGVLAQRAIANQDINDQIFAELMGEHDYVFKTALTKIDTLALILWGKQDRVIHYSNAEIFHRLIPESQTHIWDEIGHAPMIEIPEESAAVYREFVGSV